MSIFIPGAKAGGGGGGGSLSEEVLITPVEQPSHGFDSSDIGSPVYFDGSIWILAIADAPETVHAAVIRSITDANNFVIQQGGRLEGISATIVEGGGPLTPGNFYRLSANSAGLITNELITGGIINAPVYLALDTADALILPYRADLNNEEEQQIVDELNDLTDVSVPAPLDNQILAYETANNRWIAKTPAAGGGPLNLDDIDDVDATTPTDAQVLTFDNASGNWVAADTGGGDVEEAPEDGENYVRRDADWHLKPIDRASEVSAHFVVAESGKSFVKGQAVQLTDFYEQGEVGIGGTIGEQYKKWDIFIATDIRPSTAYSIPDSTTYKGIVETPSYVQQQISATYRTAMKFSVKDLIADTGAVDWKISKLVVENNMNNDDKANTRLGIYADNAGEPGNAVWDYTQFDYSSFLNDGESYHDALPLVDMVLQNGTDYWIVTEYNGSDSDVGSFRNYTNPTNQSEYISTDFLAPESFKASVDGGVSWSDNPNPDILRMRVEADLDTDIIPPSSLYGIVYNDFDEFIPGIVVIEGGMTMDTSGAPFGETWNDNDNIYVDLVTKQLTNVKPADPLDVIHMGRVLNAADTDGTLLVTAQTTAVRGIFMQNAIYDPNKKFADVFNLNNITIGVLDAARVTVDDSNFENIVGTDAQTAFDSIDDQLGAGGGVRGTIQDWGDTEIPLGTIGGGQSNIDLDGGYVISATLTGNHTINFTSTAGHANTTWEALIDVGCAKSHKWAKSHKCAGVNTLSFEFDSTPITEPDGYDISGGGMYWFRFRKLGSLVVFSERKV